MRSLSGIRVIVAAGLITAVSAALAVAAPVAAPIAAQAGVNASAPYSFGSNSFGELGDGTTTASTTPVLLSGLPSPVIQVAAGFEASAALLANGTVWTWGRNGYLGLGDADGIVDRPQQLPGLPRITQIALGMGDDGYAVAADGSLWAWGDNTYGQLGNGTTTTSYTPIQVPGLTGVWQVAAGADYVLALREDGTVWAWGSNGRGNLGDGTTASHLVPEQVPGLTAIAQVAAGDDTSFAVRDGGTLFSWGDNALGTLGTGTAGGYAVSPTPVPGLTGVTQVASNGLSTLALANAAVWSWGINDCGELGDGTTTNRYSPELILPGPITQVAAGITFVFRGFSAAIRPDGQLLTWGCNEVGQLGQGTAGGPITTPTPVAGLTGVSQIAFGAEITGLFGGAYGLVIAAAPTVPNVVGDTLAGVGIALRAAGLVVGTISTTTDWLCNDVGRVEYQNPPAGTTVAYGSAVSITIGERPPPPHECP